MKPFRHSPRRRARGFTLIEVLVAILIFSFGVLGVVGMQARMLQSSTQNGDRSRASLLANEMASTMWTQQSVTLTGTMLSDWQALVIDPTKSGLPNASGTVSYATVGGVTTATITVTWRPVNAASAASSNNQFTTTVVIP
jgi:type IV pilus assembly protein PilV